MARGRSTPRRLEIEKFETVTAPQREEMPLALPRQWYQQRSGCLNMAASVHQSLERGRTCMYLTARRNARAEAAHARLVRLALGPKLGADIYWVMVVAGA
jgi:hypothetical protein